MTDSDPRSRHTLVAGAIVVVAIPAATALWVIGDRTAARIIGVAVLVYFAVMAMSSALVAPQPIASLRMTLLAVP